MTENSKISLMKKNNTVEVLTLRAFSCDILSRSLFEVYILFPTSRSKRTIEPCKVLTKKIVTIGEESV